ncbi:MAG TPA: 50S ribosomal protein L21 [Dongiaceae bacterium]|jgi:large subunit ribosomal protein L21|nr:50S ribosomal protein L21 [Dongiaceae bacterium]
MFAIVKTGGKQYKVVKNDVITVEKLTTEPGKQITLADVLMIGEGGSLKVGTPLLAGARVTAEVVDQHKADKVLIFKKKRRHNYRRKKGHRQNVTVLKILDITAA